MLMNFLEASEANTENLMQLWDILNFFNLG
jgi:hypothetical protein